MSTAAPVSNVVLVHGGFVDGSGWQPVYDILTGHGYRVSVVQNPTLSLDGDVAATWQVIDGQPGPVVLVGHSYGGVVITEAGTHDKVAALVYIAAFAPDVGESVSTLIADPSPGAPVPPILPPKNRRGFWRAAALDYRDALSFSTILLAAAPEELFC
jgi:pimeloyl-ACP methyl ester carboxylesterase